VSNLLEVKDVSFSYSNGKPSSVNKNRFKLSDNSFSVEEKDFISIIGTNGSGKSTLVKLISRILSGYTGNIFYNGKEITSFEKKEYSRAVSYLPQTTNTFNEDLYVKEFLMLGRYAHKKFTDFNFSEDDRNIVTESINETGIKNRSDEKFSGKSLLNLSELGIPVKDVEKFYTELRQSLDIPVFSGDLKTFTAAGDESGLFIIVPDGRKWYPDCPEAKIYPASVKIFSKTEAVFEVEGYKIISSKK